MSYMNETAGEGGQIIDEPLDEALKKRYLAYALSTITARALPDIRDGLKPVQRRILYGMRALKLDPEAGYRKCAKVVGEVMGNYHPHGDASIYDAMVRLAQAFAVRYPLVDGQGNFGNVDGDSAAAMRYTESRLTPAAKLLLDGLDEDAVDFSATYDENEREPVVLPAGFPNLLANGATGIAVGMATSIPPHNVAEIIDALLVLIADREVATGDLLACMPGPDFPSGGIIVEPQSSILESYESGRGSFRIRARWTVEAMERGLWQIVVTEIPYQVQKSKLVERLADLIETKKTPLLAGVRDESAEDIRLILEPRAKTVKPDILMESLFRICDLETRFSLNMNVLHKGVPQIMGLRAVLQAYLDHRRDVLIRRARFRLERIGQRLHVLAGYLTAYLNIDAIIAIIREHDEPAPVIIARFGLTKIQAEAVLNLRLRALRKLEETAIRAEHTKLEKERRKITVMLDNEARQWQAVEEELHAVRQVFSPKTECQTRRTAFEKAPQIDMGAALEASMPKEAITVILSARGWIRSVKGHDIDPDTIRFKDGDSLHLSLQVYTSDKLIIMSSDGRAFTLFCDKLPGGRGHGQPVRMSITLEDHVDIVTMFAFSPNRTRLVACDDGYGFLVPESELAANRKAGKSVVTIPDGARLLVCIPAHGDHIALVATSRRLLVYRRDELPTISRGRGVKLQACRGPVKLADAMIFDCEDGISVTNRSGRTRRFLEWQGWVGKRGQVGKAAMKGFPASGLFVPRHDWEEK